MQPSPNYIHYRVHWQILGPDSPGQRFERAKFEEFFHKLNEDRRFSGYDDFSYRPNRCELAKSPTPGGKSFSKVVYSSDAVDTLSIVEEWTEQSVDEFTKKLKIVLGVWFASFPQTLAVVQGCCVRALTSPAHYDDAREFIGNGVLGLGSVFESKLHGMPHKVGFTFACQRDVVSTTTNLECVANSWRDTRSVWVEVRGETLLKRPLNAAGHDQAEAIFAQCSGFLEGEVLPLLFEHDRAGEEGNTESPE